MLFRQRSCIWLLSSRKSSRKWIWRTTNPASDLQANLPNKLPIHLDCQSTLDWSVIQYDSSMERKLFDIPTMQNIGNYWRRLEFVIIQHVAVILRFKKHWRHIMDMKPLNIQMARILNESNEFKCKFIVMGQAIFAIRNDISLRPFVIDPAKWLESVKGRRYEVSSWHTI